MQVSKLQAAYKAGYTDGKASTNCYRIGIPNRVKF